MTPSSMVSWALVLAAGPGSTPVADLPVAATLRYELDNDWTCKLKLPYAEPAAETFYSALSAGVPTLLAYRQDDTNIPLRFTGRLTPFREQTDSEQIGDGDSIELTFKAGPAQPLEDRLTSYETNNGTAIDDGGTLVAQDAGAIVDAIITALDTDHATGVRVGTVTTTTNRDKVYKLKNVWDAIREMSAQQIDGGYDLDVTCLDPTAEVDGAHCEIDIVASLGSDKSATVKFAYGDGTDSNCLNVTREWGKPRNRVTTTVNHANPAIGGVVAATVEDTGSITKYGLYEYAEETPDAANNADLEDRATKLLLPEPAQTVTFLPDPSATNCPQPFSDYWLGDTVEFYADQDGLQINTTERIIAIEIDIDEDGVETAHRLEYGQPKVTVPKLLGKLDSRVYWLERGNA